MDTYLYILKPYTPNLNPKSKSQMYHELNCLSLLWIWHEFMFVCICMPKEEYKFSVWCIACATQKQKITKQNVNFCVFLPSLSHTHTRTQTHCSGPGLGSRRLHRNRSQGGLNFSKTPKHRARQLAQEGEGRKWLVGGWYTKKMLREGRLLRRHWGKFERELGREGERNESGKTAQSSD